MSLEYAFSELDLNNIEDYVDITSLLKELAQKLKPNTIVKSPNFNLLEGTHALEIDNVKLDSSLLNLTEYETSFDCNHAYGKDLSERILFVTGICDKLCRSLMNWLSDYQSLPTTVLSCRYVEWLMVMYTKNPTNNLLSCQLTTMEALYDQVLASCVLATCKFINFVEGLLSAGVIFDEEDLNCNSMCLNMLGNVPISVVINNVEKSMKLLEGYAGVTRLSQIVELFYWLLHIPEYRPSFETKSLIGPNPLQKIIEISNLLKETSINIMYPPGVFSLGIQKRLSNQFPPKNVVHPSGNEFDAFISMSNDILKILQLSSCTSIVEIYQSAWFFNKCRQCHVIARALFPLYLMRDDQTVLGVYSFVDFSQQHLMEFSLCGTSISTEILKNKEIKDKYDGFLLEISNVLFEWYQNMSQNTCRYRQGFNRQLLMWDSLQATIEQFETELENVEIKDEINELNNSTLLPLTSWVYTMKLISMIEFVLKGFELQIYKSWEFGTMYWYSYYLCHHLQSSLERISKFIQQRLKYIHNMSKRLKKLKAGEKKESLKRLYRNLVEYEQPQLNRNLKFISYWLKEVSFIKSISLAQVFQFSSLKSFNIIDNFSSAKENLSTNKLIHNLRFKAFSSIGVPELPTFEIMQSSLDDFTITGPMIKNKLKQSMSLMNNELENAKNILESIIKNIETNEKNDPTFDTMTRPVRETSVEWYKSIIQTVTDLKKNGVELVNKLTSKHLLTSELIVDIKFSSDSCKYYPVLLLTSRSNK